MRTYIQLLADYDKLENQCDKLINGLEVIKDDLSGGVNPEITMGLIEALIEKYGDKS